jgi:hypothetical protein
VEGNKNIYRGQEIKKGKGGRVMCEKREEKKDIKLFFGGRGVVDLETSYYLHFTSMASMADKCWVNVEHWW